VYADPKDDATASAPGASQRQPITPLRREVQIYTVFSYSHKTETRIAPERKTREKPGMKKIYMSVQSNLQLTTGRKSLLQTRAKRYLKPMGILFLSIGTTNGIGWYELKKEMK